MKIAYLDCFSGLSGDMILGALLDIGIPFDEIRNELTKLPLTEYVMAAKPVARGSIGATKVSVKTVEKGIVRTYSNVRQIIEHSRLNAGVKERSLAVFHSLAEAQAKVNRKNLETVHFHEVGVIDSVVDIVGTAIAFDLLEVDRIYCSPLPMGIGMVRTEHGMMPLPSPVTLEILKGVPIYSTAMQAELVSPTGAAILRSFVHEYSDMPPMTTEKIGYGAGRQELDIPNVMRLIVGEPTDRAGADLVTLITAVVHGLEPATGDELIDKLVSIGAVDAWLSEVKSGRGRPAFELNVLATLDKEETLVNAVFADTGAEGVRLVRQPRRRKPKA